MGDGVCGLHEDGVMEKYELIELLRNMLEIKTSPEDHDDGTRSYRITLCLNGEDIDSAYIYVGKLC